MGNFGIIQATNQLDLGEINDFTWESLHQEYVWALWLANKYYGQPAQRNCWLGCSTGGRQGLSLAEKWGGDFDGIVAGAPAAFNTEFVLAQGWPELVNRRRCRRSGSSRPHRRAGYQDPLICALKKPRKEAGLHTTILT